MTTRKARARSRFKKSAKSAQNHTTVGASPYNHSPAYLEKLRSTQDLFLKYLVELNHHHGAAARAAGVGIRTVLDWRNDDADFQKRYLKTMEILPVRIQDEIIRRGIAGYEGRGVFFEGKCVQRVTEYSDTALLRLAAAHDRKFRPTVLDGVPGDGKYIIEIASYADKDKAPA